MVRTEIEVDGTRVLIEGEGPATVLMIHGWPDTLALWDATVERLRDRWRCVRFTLPGYDVSGPARPMSLEAMIAHFDAIARAVSPDVPVTLLLHDWGAVFGYQFAAAHPDRVARVIGVDVGDTFSRRFMASLALRARLGVFGYQVWLAIAFKLGGALGTRMTRNMARWLRCRADPALIGWQMNYPYVMQWSGGFSGARQWQPQVPMLYLYGERKPFMFHSPKWLEIVQATPGGEVRAMPTGHWVMVQQPQAFADAVARWLAHAPSAAQGQH